MRTADDGSNRSEDARSIDESPNNARDARGRFAQGNRYGRGRPVTSITRELRRITDAAEEARFYLMVRDNPEVGWRERLQAADRIYERLEPTVKRSMTLHAHTSLLPRGFNEMSPEQRERLLDDDEAWLLSDGGNDA